MSFIYASSFFPRCVERCFKNGLVILEEALYPCLSIKHRRDYFVTFVIYINERRRLQGIIQQRLRVHISSTKSAVKVIADCFFTRRMEISNVLEMTQALEFLAFCFPTQLLTEIYGY